MRGALTTIAIGLGLSLAAAGCLDSGTVACGDTVCPTGTTCGPTGNCVDADRLEACTGLADGDICSYNGVSGTCRGGVCDPLECGDGLIVAPEQCEGTNLNGATCLTYGFYEPDGLACQADCLVDTTACRGACGDGMLNGPELCDTVPGDVFTCYEVGFDYGSVACSSALCAPVYSGCSKVGWTPHQQFGDYPQELWSPRAGEMMMPDGSVYLHINGAASTDVLVPPGCGPAAVWSASTGEVFTSGFTTLCRQIGDDWTMYPIPDGGNVVDIFGDAADDLYAAGSAMLHFDGLSWTPVDTLAPAGTVFTRLEGRIGGTIAAPTTGGGVALHDATGWHYEVVDPGVRIDRAWVSPDNTVYLVGSGNGYVRSGATWQPFGPPDADYIEGVWGVADRAVFVYGRSPTTSDLLWYFDGAHWLKIATPASSVLLAGGPSTVILTEIYFVLHETNGYTWTEPSPPLPQSITAIWAFAPDDIIAFGNNLDYRFDGTTWLSHPLPGGYVNAVWASGPGRIVAVGNQGARLDYNGTTWRNQASASAQLAAVWGETPDRIFAGGRDSNAPVIHMFDGTSWTEVLRGPDGFYPFAALWGSPTAGTYAFTTYAASMYHHAPGDPPTTWTEIPLPSTNPVGMWGDDQRLIVTFGDRRVFSLANGTWTQELTSHLLITPTRLVGAAGDVFGLTAEGAVRYDGVSWDRIRMMDSFTGEITAVHAGNGAVVFGGDDGRVVMLVRPQP